MNDSQGDPRRRRVAPRLPHRDRRRRGRRRRPDRANWPRPPPPSRPPAPAYGPAPVLLELTVNGKKVTTNVEPRVTLLDALRNYLDVTGCKRVCDRGTCGACTVMLNGRTVYSCTMLALEARGADIRTAESLGGGGRLDAVPGRVRRATTPSSAASARPGSSSRCGPPSTRTRTPRPSRSRRPSPATSAAAAPTSRCGTPSSNSARRGAESWQKVGPKSAASSAPRSSGSTAPTRPPAGRSTATTSTARACCTA